MFESDYESTQEESSKSRSPNIGQFSPPSVQKSIRVKTGAPATNKQQQIQPVQRLRTIENLTNLFEKRGLVVQPVQTGNTPQQPIPPIYRPLEKHVSDIPEKVSLSMNGDETSESEENGSNLHLIEILALLNPEDVKKGQPVQIQGQKLTNNHFVMFQKKFNFPMGLLIGFQNYITAPDGQIKQPTTYDVISYLRRTVPVNKEVNMDMINRCIDKFKTFFKWTSLRNIYPNIASSITVKNLVEGRIPTTPKRMPIINRNDGQLRVQAVQPHILNVRVADTNGPVPVQEKKSSARKPRLEKNDQIAQGYAFDTQWLNTYIDDVNYHEQHIFREVYIHPLNLLMDYFKENKISNPKPSDIAQFFVFYRRMANKKYINKYLTAFKRFFEWTEDRTKNSNIYYPNIRKHCPEQREIKQLVDDAIINDIQILNKQLETASFKPHYIDDFIAKTKDLPPPDRINPKLIGTLERFRDYLGEFNIKQPGQQDILNFFAEYTEYSSRRGIKTMLSTFEKLFEWTSLHKDKNGQCFYPDIWAILPTATQVAKFIGQDDQETDSQTEE